MSSWDRLEALLISHNVSGDAGFARMWATGHASECLLPQDSSAECDTVTLDGLMKLGRRICPNSEGNLVVVPGLKNTLERGCITSPAPDGTECSECEQACADAAQERPAEPSLAVRSSQPPLSWRPLFPPNPPSL